MAGALQAEGFDVRAIRPPTRAARHRAAARLGQRRRCREDDAAIGSSSAAARSALEGGPAAHAPRPLRNRHRHRTSARPSCRRRSMHPLPADGARCATGSRFRPASSKTTTPRTVAALGGCAPDEVLDEGVRLPRPLSPHLAARLAGRRIELDALVDAVAAAQPTAERWIVEGAGGVLVPVNDRRADGRSDGARSALPVVVVARSDASARSTTRC